MIIEKIKADDTIKHNLVLLDEVLQHFGLSSVLKNKFFNITPGFNEKFWLGIELEKPNSINIWFLIDSDINIGLDGSSEVVLIEPEKLQSKEVQDLLEILLKSYIEIIYYGEEKYKEIYFYNNDKKLLKRLSISNSVLPNFLIKKLYKEKRKYFEPIISE